MDYTHRLVTLPNVISLLRIIVIVSSIFYITYEYVFLVMYLIAGLTDVLDGLMARLLKQQSSLDAKLDSFADMIFFGVLLTFVIINRQDIMAFYLPAILFIAVFKFVPIFLYIYRFKKLVIAHTTLNKITGLLLFLSPIVLIMYDISLYITILLVFAFITIIEEIAIACMVKEVDYDIHSILYLTENTRVTFKK